MTFRLDTESLNKEPTGSQNLQQSQDRRSIVCPVSDPSLILSCQSCMQSQTVGHTTDCHIIASLRLFMVYYLLDKTAFQSVIKFIKHAEQYARCINLALTYFYWPCKIRRESPVFL